jgi:hypothetical protein
MRYRELAPGRELARFVLSFWEFRVSARAAQLMVHTVFPDGCTLISYATLLPPGLPRLRVTGPLLQPRRGPVQPGLVAWGVRLQPAACRAVLGYLARGSCSAGSRTRWGSRRSSSRARADSVRRRWRWRKAVSRIGPTWPRSSGSPIKRTFSTTSRRWLESGQSTWPKWCGRSSTDGSSTRSPSCRKTTRPRNRPGVRLRSVCLSRSRLRRSPRCLSS